MRAFIVLALCLGACGAADQSDEIGSDTEELLGGPTFPQPRPVLQAISPATGTPGSQVRITGPLLGQLACTGGRQISLYWLVYADSAAGTNVACTLNGDGSITATVPATATVSAPFELKQFQNPCGPIGFCQQPVTVSRSPVFTLSPGTLVIDNRSQATMAAWTIDGVPQSGTVAAGARRSFTVNNGSHAVVMAMDVLTASGSYAEVCGESANVTISSGQTWTLGVGAFTAGQWLTHCAGSVDYSGTDAFGDFIRIRIFSNDTWQEFDSAGTLIGSGNIMGDSISAPWVSFNIGGVSVSGFGWPYDSFFVTISNVQFLLERDINNPW